MGMYGNVFIGLAVGFFVVIQGAMNARVMTALGSVMSATLVNFCIGAAVLLGVMAVSGHIATIQNLATAPRWSLLAGVVGLLLVMGTALLIPRIGTAHTVALIVCGQALASLLVDHYGWFGVPVMEISMSRIAGCALLAIGAILIGR